MLANSFKLVNWSAELAKHSENQMCGLMQFIGLIWLATMNLKTMLVTLS